MQENYPILISCKLLKPEYAHLKKISITSEYFTLGRGMQNLVIVPFLAISRQHCVFKKNDEDEWSVEDVSSLGIEVNGSRLGKGVLKKLSHEDVITLEPSHEFVYRFIDPSFDDFDIPKKRIRLDNDNDLINNVKIKFEESQSYEIKHIEEKIQNNKNMQTTSIILKQQLQLDMNRKMEQLEINFASQIENLKGEKNEVERQKALLIEERDAQLATVKLEMEEKITELMEQIKKRNETESELLKENSDLKEKLLKERDEFLSELSRESSSKQELLDKLESKMKEQEEKRLKEKQELEDTLKKETEQLRLAKEKELKDLEEQKRQRELELIEELNKIKKNYEEQVEQTEQQKLKVEQQLNEQMEQMKKLSDEEKVKMEQLVKEREEIQNKLLEAQTSAEQSVEKMKSEVKDREIELAALAADRIQKQAEQSSEVINSLQAQLENVKSQLQTVEIEKNTLLESICMSDPCEGSSKQTELGTEVGDLMEAELQCSICAEVFIVPTTLNCSHTFCKYCITMWKKKKKDCPICRAPITSECRSLVLDTFIDKVVQNSKEEVKKKRQELLKFRDAEVAAAMAPPTTTPTTSRRGRRNSRTRNTTYGRRGTASAASTAMSTTTARTTTTRTTTTRTTTTNSVPIVDLTSVPITPPPPRALPTPLHQAQMYRVIQQNGHTVMVLASGVDAGSSLAPRAPTTAATDDASVVVLEDTGPPAAHSANLSRLFQ